jgi:hypothetical protein
MVKIRKKVQPFIKKNTQLIENDGKRNWLLSVQPDLITHAEPNNKNWLAGKFNEIFQSVKKDRQKRNEREENAENLKKGHLRKRNKGG